MSKDSNEDFLFSDINSVNLQALTKLGFLVKKEVDEKQILIEKLKNNNLLYLAIIYNSGCNMDCVYCYEKHLPTIRMKKTTKNDLLKWITNYVKDNKEIKKISYCPFGGEPLIDLENLLFFADEIKEISIKQELEFEIVLTTNGTLLNNRILELLISKGLKGLRFTLDGPEQIHNKRRPYKNGKGTYKKILSALTLACQKDQLQTGLEVNVDKHNIFSLHQLFDELQNLELGDKIIIAPELVLPGAIEGTHSKDYKFEKKELVEVFKYVIMEARKYHLRLSGTMLNTFPCPFTSPHHVIVDPNGKIFKCSFTVGVDECSFGNIQDKGYDNSNEGLVNLLSSCESCKFLPICGGGCRYLAWKNNGDFKKINCQKELLEAILPLNIEYIYENKIVEASKKFRKNNV